MGTRSRRCSAGSRSRGGRIGQRREGAASSRVTSQGNMLSDKVLSPNLLYSRGQVTRILPRRERPGPHPSPRSLEVAESGSPVAERLVNF